MSTQATQPLSLLRVDFDDLYARHLGRHSQFGINVAHLAALYGMWFGVYGAIYEAALLLGLPAGAILIVALALAYLGAVAINAPCRACVATAAFLALLVASVLTLPKLPGWSIMALALVVPAFYKIQAWSHKIWTKGADMTEFNKRFPPGRALNSILMVYEVPICLNYLLFRRSDWRR
jgi:hypothetical protein